MEEPGKYIEKPNMNDHPRRDTVVISRPSKSTIKDLTFYIGFTRIGSRIQDLGSCFGMNGHFRRDPDVISRLPESTIESLSFFIGFGSLSSVNNVVVDKTCRCSTIFRKKSFVLLFFLEIVLGLFRDRKSIYRDRNIDFFVYILIFF